MTPQEVAGGTRVAADMMRKIMDGFGANAVSIAAMISIFAALNGSILSGARVREEEERAKGQSLSRVAKPEQKK